MNRKFYSMFAFLVILALVLTACGGGGEEADTGDGESILARVKERGKLICGGRTDLLGFGYLDADGNNIGFRVVCSKGTYIRSFARDIGEWMDSGAHLTALTRTRIGEFSLENAFSIEDFEKKLLELKQS